MPGCGEVAASYLEDLVKIIKEGSYTKKQIFNTDETAFGKKMPSKLFITREEKSISSFKTLKDRLTFMLGTSTAGDCKLKPVLIYHSKKLRVPKDDAKLTLLVLYK